MIIFATKNKDKLKEIQKIIPGVISMDDAGYGHIDVIEDGKTYKENAAKKAYAVMIESGTPVLSDDSGIEIAYFKNQPGVNAAYWLGGNSNYKQRNLEIIEQMKEAIDRTAIYTCTIALFLPNKSDDCKNSEKPWEEYEHYFTTGTLAGEIAKKPFGKGGFAYDEIFYVKSQEKTLAELNIDEKNKISHRNMALQKMKNMLKELKI